MFSNVAVSDSRVTYWAERIKEKDLENAIFIATASSTVVPALMLFNGEGVIPCMLTYLLSAYGGIWMSCYSIRQLNYTDAIPSLIGAATSVAISAIALGIQLQVR